MADNRGSNNLPPPGYYEQSGGDDCKKSPLPPSSGSGGHPASGKPTNRFSHRLHQIYLSWVPVAKNGDIPARALEGRDGVGIFIARAHSGYQLLPGKAARGHRCCHASHNGKEMRFMEYEVLCDSSMASFGHVAYDWVASYGASLPHGALAGGCNDRGEPLYVVRGSVNGERVFGYVDQSLGVASFPYGGQEHKSGDFELLVLR